MDYYGHTATNHPQEIICERTGEDAVLATVSFSDILVCSECREVDPVITPAP